VWLVTGASSGFGRSIAEAALAVGETVVATARRTETLDELAAIDPERVVVLQLDVTDEARIRAIVDEVVADLGRIDVVVNNAGRGHVGAVEESTDSELRDLTELHFFGPAALTRAVLPHMRRQGGGAIVQMSSQGGRFSFPGVGAYSATKFALEGLSEALAQEVASFGIKILIVEPGSFRTGLLGGAMTQSTPIDAYDDSAGATRHALSSSHGNQAGDPAKAAAAILTALAAEETPLRLPLGNDAADAISRWLDRTRQEFRAWEGLARSTDFDE
jgi:NAD(P)-dependent dehydrogenase (short-subunit alcohol dehydrogenase family)